MLEQPRYKVVVYKPDAQCMHWMWVVRDTTYNTTYISHKVCECYTDHHAELICELLNSAWEGRSSKL